MPLLGERYCVYSPHVSFITFRLPGCARAAAPDAGACALTHSVEVVNELGEREQVQIPAERPLTIYVDKRELVTLMTLGAQPELLVLGYLRNQRLVESVFDIESITVDWEVHAAAVRTRHGIARIEERTASKVVTTGCGQGSVFGGLMDEVDRITLPEARLTQGELYGIVNAIRLKETTYKSAGSVHGCALFGGGAAHLRGRRGAPQRHRHHCRVDVDEYRWQGSGKWRFLHAIRRHACRKCRFGEPARAHVRCRQGVLHHGPTHQRNGHQICADGCPHRGVPQRHDPDGARRSAATGPVRHRARHQSPVCLLQRYRSAGAAAGAGAGTRRTVGQRRSWNCLLRRRGCVKGALRDFGKHRSPNCRLVIERNRSRNGMIAP